MSFLPEPGPSRAQSKRTIDLLRGVEAGLTGIRRTANVITEEDSEFLIIPSKVLKRLASHYPTWNVMLHTTIDERLSLTALPRGTVFDQPL